MAVNFPHNKQTNKWMGKRETRNKPNASIIIANSRNWLSTVRNMTFSRNNHILHSFVIIFVCECLSSLESLLNGCSFSSRLRLSIESICLYSDSHAKTIILQFKMPYGLHSGPYTHLYSNGKMFNSFAWRSGTAAFACENGKYSQCAFCAKTSKTFYLLAAEVTFGR